MNTLKTTGVMVTLALLPVFIGSRGAHPPMEERIARLEEMRKI